MNWQLSDFILKLLGLISIAIAAWNVWSQRKIKHVEWLKSLYEKFYEGSNYKSVRKWIDFDELESELKNDPKNDKQEQLSDFLNFFEFIAIIEKTGQLTISEVNDLFSYYLNRMIESQYCLDYIKQYRFKNLSNLLDKQLKYEARRSNR